MRYALLICDDESDSRTPAEMESDPEFIAWNTTMEKRGILIGGQRLRPTSDATTVRHQDGEVLVSDGPFAESKEQMGGFILIDVENLDEAIEVASSHPCGGSRTVEIRPLWD